MSRATATERLQRILVVLPYVVQHPGVTLDELSRRFGISHEDLVDDLDFVLVYVGLHPFTPDMLTEVVVDDGRVTVHVGDYFRRPLRLTHTEGLRLLTAGRALAARSGTDPDGTLERAVGKLAAVLGDPDAVALQVRLGAADPEVLAVVADAVRDEERLQLEYYSYGRDTPATRLVDPLRVVARDGSWYLLAFCHLADGQRLFRVDRIRQVRSTGEHFEPLASPGEGRVDFDGAARSVELVAPEAARWLLEANVTDEIEELRDGRIRVVLPVTATAWLERLLLRLGPSARARDVATGESLDDVGVAAARRLLTRYRPG